MKNKKTLIFVLILILLTIFIFTFESKIINATLGGQGDVSEEPVTLSNEGRIESQSTIETTSSSSIEATSPPSDTLPGSSDSAKNDPTQADQSTQALQAATPGETKFSKAAFAVSKSLARYESKSELSNLFLKANEKADFRESIDRFFAENYLGTQYYESAICAQWYPIADQGIGRVETPDGTIEFIGRVEADRSEPMPVACQTQEFCKKIYGSSAKCQNSVCQINNQLKFSYFYKITGTVRAPSDKKYTPHYDEGTAVEFNVWLYGENPVPIFLDQIKLDNGEMAKFNLPPFYSPNYFDKICIEFGFKAPKTITQQKGGAALIPLTGVFNPQDGTLQKICNNIAGTQRSYINSQNNPASIPASGGSSSLNPSLGFVYG